MNCRCTTAAFTLFPVPGGLCHLVLTRPETEPSMRFLSACLCVARRQVGSHLCTRACGASHSSFACRSGPVRPWPGRSRHLSRRSPFRPPLAGLPLPSASSYICPTIEHYRYSYRGLSPHQFMPMSDVHKALERTPLRGCAPMTRWESFAFLPRLGVPLSSRPVSGYTCRLKIHGRIRNI